MTNYESNVEQLELLSVKESNDKRVPAKRVDILSLRLVKETSRIIPVSLIQLRRNSDYPDSHSHNSDTILIPEDNTKK